jgi:hypothetical protein
MKRRRQHKAGLLQELFQVWHDLLHPPRFERCPCPTCGGMVSTQENMIRGHSDWFCTVANRDRFEAAAEMGETSYLRKAS